MTFLELCKRLREDAGISGTGPDTVVGQNGILSRVINWVRNADLDIQRAKTDWQFLWHRGFASLAAGVQDYSFTDLGVLDIAKVKSMRIGTQPVREISWDSWMARYDAADPATNIGTPYYFAKAPDNRLYFYPTPSADAQARIEYFAEPKALADNGDVSAIPAEYQEIIIARALMDYAQYESDGEMYQMANARYRAKYTELCNRFLPHVSVL